MASLREQKSKTEISKGASPSKFALAPVIPF
jgi:hypothetical protein